jgi:hypothetical protein
MHETDNLKMLRDRFVKALASFLADRAAFKSIALESGNGWAKEWSALRNATPLFGYPSAEEAAVTLEAFLVKAFAPATPDTSHRITHTET